MALTGWRDVAAGAVWLLGAVAMAHPGEAKGAAAVVACVTVTVVGLLEEGRRWR